MPSSTSTNGTPSDLPKACFIGLGAMGAGMAENLSLSSSKTPTAIQAPLRVYDLRQEAMQQLSTRTQGAAQPASSLQDAAKDVDFIVLMVINEAQVRSVLFGDGKDGSTGALAHSKEGATVLLMSTIAPAASADIAKLVEATGRHLIDAPVSGGMVGAQSGTLTIMASGPQAIYTKAEPLLKSMGSKLYHVSTEKGKGQAMKAVNQVLCAIHLVAAAEALSFAKASGIDPAMALSLTSESAASSWFLRDRGSRMLTDDPEHVKSAINIIAKDAGIVINAARETGAALPLTAQALQILNASQGRGEGLLDDSQVIRSYDLLNGTRGASVARTSGAANGAANGKHA